MQKRICGAEYAGRWAEYAGRWAEYAGRWAEYRVNRERSEPEMENLERFRPEGVSRVEFSRAICHPAILAFVLSLSENDELDDRVNLFEAILKLGNEAANPENPVLPLPLPAFEFKLWCLVWVQTAGSSIEQVELHDVLSCCHERGLIEFVHHEKERAEQLIHDICGGPHIHWESMTNTPFYDHSEVSRLTPEFVFDRVSGFGYSRRRYA
jgi:hypothetical protein